MISLLNEVLIIPLLYLLLSCGLWVNPPSTKVVQKDSKTSIELGEGYVEKGGRDFMQREGFLHESAEVNKCFN